MNLSTDRGLTAMAYQACIRCRRVFDKYVFYYYYYVSTFVYPIFSYVFLFGKGLDDSIPYGTVTGTFEPKTTISMLPKLWICNGVLTSETFGEAFYHKCHSADYIRKSFIPLQAKVIINFKICLLHKHDVSNTIKIRN